ncbi:MAG: 7-cyano-7-deazaguanine synthase QueC [Rhodospirillales bacterium]|nr:7-cyano-7-deazaguanine synthase QueC [Rhodospirillales bacterium]
MGRSEQESSAALVLFSGGQDSTTCLAWALARFPRVETFAVDYGQRHAVELRTRIRILSEIRNRYPRWAPRLGPDHVVALPALGSLSETALTRDAEIRLGQNGLPTTYVPGRNIALLTFAAIVAYRRGLRHLVGGMCETDYSGYPDCRDDAIKALQVALNIGMDSDFVIHTPLMWRDKSEIWRLARHLGGEKLIALIVEHSHTCYLGDRDIRHPWGSGCGTCPACELRAAGYRRFRGDDGLMSQASEHDD